MLLSMTGHGEAHRHQTGMAIAVEVRTVNNRYFKLSVRCSEGYASLEPLVEAVVREHVRRGTVQINLRVDRELTSDDYRLNESVLLGYMKQLDVILQQHGSGEPARFDALLALPGVVNELGATFDAAESHWPLIEPVFSEALKNLARMRSEEGKAMLADLTSNLQTIARELTHIEARAPLVIESYRGRIQERLAKMLAEFGVSVGPADVAREVGLFAERTDISEEIVRLKCHLEQFDKVMQKEETPGRKLDFLTQEMFRETNTIGSKANDADIARHVIEIKSIIERIREMVQNVE
ncbi:MAG: YicC family protein [Planctomycetales bacterium]|nr:YicC family protein [Planctomycetales bacterium]